MSDKYITIGAADMTWNKPCLMQYASCITSRYDAGICKHQKERTGVLLKKVGKEDKNE